MCIRRLGGTSSCCQLLLIISCVGQALMVNDTAPIAPFQNESAITASVSGTTEYLVYPATLEEDISRLEHDIERSFAPEYVEVFRNAGNGVEFWVVKMNDIDHRKLSLRNPSVRAQSDISADSNLN